jgi:hypothetical protein
MKKYTTIHDLIIGDRVLWMLSPEEELKIINEMEELAARRAKEEFEAIIEAKNTFIY